MGNQIEDFLDGKVTKLVLGGDPPDIVRGNLRRLRELGLLTEHYVWALLGNAQVDPIFLVNFVKGNKGSLQLRDEESVLGDCVYFQYGQDVDGHSQVALSIDVFTNDVTVLSYDPVNSTYVTAIAESAESIYKSVSSTVPGPGRVDVLTDVIKDHLRIGLQYHRTLLPR